MGNKHKILLILVVLALAGLACMTVDRFMCRIQGKIWTVEDGRPNCDPPDSVSEDNTDSDLDSGGNSPLGEDAAGEDTSTDNQNPQPVESQYAPEYADPIECAAPENLHIDMEVTKRTDTSSETRCNYSVTFTNTGSELMWVFLHKRNKLLGAEPEEFWKNHVTLPPGKSQVLRYSTVYYKTQDDQKIEILIGVAPIAATEGCKNTFQYDTAPRETIGYPVNVPCE